MTEQITDKLAPKLPAYIDLLYGDVYNDMDKSNLRDHKWSVQLRSLFQYQNLVNAAVREVKMNQRVLQMGATFGNELDQIAQRVGAYGCFDVIDINQHQVDRCLEKYGDIYPGMHFHCQDAAEFKTDAPYDVVILFLLLSELPNITKAKVINAAMRAVKDGGSVIFIDYHNPERYHPLRYLVRMYNRLYHPFVEKLWDRDIDTFAENRTDFVWRKSTYFGRMFQKVVATRKELLVDDEPRAPERPSFLFRNSKAVLLFLPRLRRPDQVCSVV